MKTVVSLIFLSLIAWAGSATAQVRETPVVIALVDGGNPQGYIQNTNDQGILFATTPGGRGNPIAYAKIRGEGLDKLIRFEERVEVLGEGRALFAAEQYPAAAEAFGKVARDYAIILNAPQNFATEALFYQAESLKRAGQYGKLAALLEAPEVKTIETKLSDRYQRPFEIQKLWGLLGAEKFDALGEALAKYQDTPTGNAKLLATPNFKDGLPLSEISQFAFLRAKVADASGQKENALDDYYRAFTLAYGNDELLSKLSMGAAMQIQIEDPQLQAKKEQAVSMMQSLAYLFAKRFGKDIMPPQYQEYAVRPPMAQVAAEAPKEEADAGGDAEAAAPAAEGAEGGAKEETPAAEGAEGEKAE